MKNTELNNILSRINLIAVLDHSGRAGNGFFLTIFDQHPEVISCPWIHYIYSYFITAFGNEQTVDSKKAHALATQKTYFKYAYNNLDDKLSGELYKMGADSASIIDRAAVRTFFDEMVLKEPTITRKKLISSIYLSFAVGRKKDLSMIKYALVSDAVSLRTEKVLNDFSGNAIIAMKEDFNNAKLVSLVRDPRANFASNRHQYVNSFGNMYAIRFGNYFKQIFQLAGKKLNMESSCVYLFWLCYFASAARTISRFKKKYSQNFITVKNEDLNIDFVKTITTLAEWLNISFFEEWRNPDYHPTIVGFPWAGTGAYNSRYQKVLNGPLENDSQEVSGKVAGPNKYVTERWKKKMNKNEIYIVEKLFHNEMVEMKYEFMYYNIIDKEISFINALLMPFSGEIPSLTWINKGRSSGIKEMFGRLFYSIGFPPFYLLSRIILFNLIGKGFFSNDYKKS